MHLWSATRLPTAAIAWRAADRSLSLTAIGKATFKLDQGTAPLAAVQEPIAAVDVLDALGAPCVAGDLVPFKSRTDVLLVGSAFPPHPAAACNARVLVGTVSKAVELAPGAAARGALSALAPRGAADPQRARLAGARGGHPQWYRQPLPDDLHSDFWNAAPPDQQSDTLPDPIGIRLEHLSPVAKQLVATLAPVHFSLYAEGGGVTGSHALLPDTVWIDTDRQIVCVTYRATLALDDHGELRATILADAAAFQQGPAALPVLGGSGTDPLEDADDGDVPIVTSFVQLTPAELDLVRGALPFRPARNDAPPAPALAPPPPVTSPPVAIAAPAFAPTAVAVPAHAPPVVSPATRPLAPPPASPATRPLASPPPLPARAFSEVQPARPALMHEAGGALAGVAGASDAAARTTGAEGRRRRRSFEPERPRPASSDLCDLLWFEPTTPARIRTIDAWAPAVRDHAGERTWLTSDETLDQAQADKDRRSVTRALARVTPAELSTLPRLLAESFDDDGFVERPLLVVAGELSIPFDPCVVLEATAELASALAGTERSPDKTGAAERLREAIESAGDPGKGQRPSAAVVQTILSKIRHAFAQLNRALPADYLESTVQQTLLEERRHQVREVLGAPHVFAQIQPGTGAATTVYLPEEAAAVLPLLSRFRARLVTEPHPQQHGGDGDGPVLRALAIGRVIAQRPRGSA